MPETAEDWKERYLLERERLVKLYVAYKTLEAEIEGDDVDDGVDDSDEAGPAQPATSPPS